MRSSVVIISVRSITYNGIGAEDRDLDSAPTRLDVALGLLPPRSRARFLLHVARDILFLERAFSSLRRDQLLLLSSL
jgi:hypothetical protein